MSAHMRHTIAGAGLQRYRKPTRREPFLLGRISRRRKSDRVDETVERLGQRRWAPAWSHVVHVTVYSEFLPRAYYTVRCV